MSLRPWHVVVGWGIGNLVLVGVLFAFDEKLWAELLYLAAGFPLAVFAAAVWYSDHISHSGARSIGGSAIAALPFAFGCALIGIGVIYATWIAIVGALMVLVTGAQLLRSAPARLPPPVADLARLPVRRLDSPPTFSTAAMEEESEGESQDESQGADRPSPDGATAESGRGAAPPATTSVAVVAAAGAWVREVVRARRRKDEQ